MASRASTFAEVPWDLNTCDGLGKGILDPWIPKMVALFGFVFFFGMSCLILSGIHHQKMVGMFDPLFQISCSKSK